MEYIYQSAHDFNGTSKVLLSEEINGKKYYEVARTPNRYAAVRGVWGTPTFFINNARQFDLNHASTVDDWKRVFDKLTSN